MFWAPPHRPPIVVPAPGGMPVLLGWLGRTGLSACIRLGSLMHGYGKTAAPRCTPAFPGRAMAPLRLISLPSLAQRDGPDSRILPACGVLARFLPKIPPKPLHFFRIFQVLSHNLPTPRPSPNGILTGGDSADFFHYLPTTRPGRFPKTFQVFICPKSFKNISYPPPGFRKPGGSA